MQWVLLVFAVVAAAIAAGLMWARSRAGSEMAAMAATETSTARDVAGMAAGALVELKGTFRCATPLTSEFAQKPCVWYRALTEREVEKHDVDSDGKSQTRREYETESDVIKASPGVVIEDATGSVAVDFDGAKVEGEQVHRRTEAPGLGQSVVTGLLGVGTLRYRYTEWAVAADIPIYLLGTVIAGGRVGKSTGTKQPFVISIKSEEERNRSLGRARTWQMVGAVGAGLIAVVLLVAAIANWGQ